VLRNLTEGPGGDGLRALRDAGLGPSITSAASFNYLELLTGDVTEELLLADLQALVV
jgi:hypothetical protein